MGLLERLRHHRGFRHLVVLTIVRERFGGPGLPDDFERLLKALAALLTRNIEALEMDRDGPTADAEVEPSAAKNVNRRGFRCQAQRMMKRQQRNASAEPDAPRALRDGGGHDQR